MRSPLLVAAGLIVTACGDAAPPAATVAVDTLHVDLAIGAVEGDGPEVFGRVSGLATTEAGEILVADAGVHTVHGRARRGVRGPSHRNAIPLKEK